MGTVMSFDLRGPQAHEVDLGPAIAWLHAADARFSTFRPDSEVCRLDRGELAAAGCHPDVEEVLARGRAAERASWGAFDMHATGRLDPSGVVKGWAVEHAAWLVQQAGSSSHLVNGGGDVQTCGPDRWRVAIADPRDSGRILDVVAGAGIAVATSGTAERGAHIVDGRTGLPAAQLRSITVVGTTGLADVDVAATTALALGDQARDWLALRPDLAALAVTAAGQVWTTAGWRQWSC